MLRIYLWLSVLGGLEVAKTAILQGDRFSFNITTIPMFLLYPQYNGHCSASWAQLVRINTTCTLSLLYDNQSKLYFVRLAQPLLGSAVGLLHQPQLLFCQA